LRNFYVLIPRHKHSFVCFPKDIIHADPEFLKSVASIRQQRLQIAPETRDSSFEFSIEQNVSLIDDDDEDEDEEDADEIVDREVALRIAEHQRQNEAQSENEIRITLKPGEGRELKIKVFKDSQFGEVIKRMRQHFRVNQVKLQFDGETISNNQTPMDLDMEDDDIVDMYMNWLVTSSLLRICSVRWNSFEYEQMERCSGRF